MDKHLFLIGMQGCGKSSLGKRTAKETGVPFADTDHSEKVIKIGEKFRNRYSSCKLSGD